MFSAECGSCSGAFRKLVTQSPHVVGFPYAFSTERPHTVTTFLTHSGFLVPTLAMPQSGRSNICGAACAAPPCANQKIRTSFRCSFMQQLQHPLSIPRRCRLCGCLHFRHSKHVASIFVHAKVLRESSAGVAQLIGVGCGKEYLGCIVETPFIICG